MGRPGLTQEEVLKTIEQLTAEGVEATAPAVRQRLGRGSYTTISTVLSEWRSEREKASQPEIPEMPGALQQLTRHIWNEAWKLAFSVHESERMSFGRDRQEFEKVKGEMESEINRLERELDEEVAKSVALRAEIEDVRVRLANTEGRADSAERRVKELDRRNQELSDRLTAEASKASALSERLKHFEGPKVGKKGKR